MAFMHGADGGKMREMIYSEVRSEMEALEGSLKARGRRIVAACARAELRQGG